MRKLSILGLICLLVLVPGCKKQLPTSPDLWSPVINYFNANPAEVSYGDYSKLSWSTVGALRVFIDNGVGDVPLAGTKEIKPSHTATYVLTAYGEENTKSRSVKIIVNR